jgi:hypothetical protein
MISSICTAGPDTTGEPVALITLAVVPGSAHILRSTMSCTVRIGLSMVEANSAPFDAKVVSSTTSLYSPLSAKNFS